MTQDSIFYGSKNGWSTAVAKKFMFNPALSMEARALWVVLKLFLSPDKPCAYPGMQLLSEITGWHRTTLWRRMLELVEHRYLAKKQRGQAKANLYALFDDPKDWRDPLHWSLNSDGSVTMGDADRESDQLQKATDTDSGCSTAATLDVPPLKHKMLQERNTENAKTAVQQPAREGVTTVTDRAKNIHSKKKPKEEEAASPLSPNFVSEGTPEEAQKQLQPGEVAREDTVEFMVMEVAKNYPRLYMKVAERRSVIMSQPSREAATEFFQDTKDWSIPDVIYVGLKGFLEAKAHPYPGKGNDDFWACRRFTSPNQIFALSPDNEYRLIRMAIELNYAPGDISHDEVYGMIQDLLRGKRSS